MNRRTFLSVAAGAPLVFGLRELLAQEPKTEAKSVPEWYTAALKRMKETNRYGIVFILPEDAKEREELGKALIDRYNEHGSYRHEPFGAVVFICLTPGLAARLLDGVSRDRNLFVLTPEGRTFLRAQEWTQTLQESRRFELAFTEYAYGLRDQRLIEQAKTIDKTVPDSTRKAALELLGEKWTPAAEAVILEKADSIFPWLISQCRELESKTAGNDGERPDPSALRLALAEYVRRQSLLESDPCLPYGMKVEVTEERDLCSSCGRNSLGPGKARMFLSFYEK